MHYFAGIIKHLLLAPGAPGSERSAGAVGEATGERIIGGDLRSRVGEHGARGIRALPRVRGSERARECIEDLVSRIDPDARLVRGERYGGVAPGTIFEFVSPTTRAKIGGAP